MPTCKIHIRVHVTRFRGRDVMAGQDETRGLSGQW